MKCLCAQTREMVNLFDNSLARWCAAVSKNVITTSTKWITIACKLNTENLFVVRTHQGSWSSGIIKNFLYNTVFSFPIIDTWWITFFYVAADCIPVDSYDLNTIYVSSYFLKDSQEIIFWLQESSWNMVPEIYKSVRPFFFIYKIDPNMM